MTRLSLPLLLLLAVPLSQTVAIAASELSPEQLHARANARIGLAKALNKLQAVAGKDTVATAPSSIVGDIPGNIFAGIPTVDGASDRMLNYTGVWDLEGKVPDAGVWSADDFPADAPSPEWLVSGEIKVSRPIIRDRSEGFPNNSYWPHVGHISEETGNREYMVVVSPRDSDRAQPFSYYPVAAGLEEVDPTRDLGRYAWWASDESLKPKVNIPNPYDEEKGATDLSDEEKALNLMVPQGARGLGLIDALEGLEDLSNETIAKFVDSSQLRFVMPDAQNQVLRSFFHKATTHSRMVLADSRNGGLRKDLAAALRPGSGIFADDGLTRIFPPFRGSSTAGDPGGPRWAQLQSFFNLHTSLSQSETGYSIAPRPQTETQMGVYPVVTMFQMFYVPAFKEYTIPGTPSDPTERTEYQATIHIVPAVVLWNPYAVKLSLADYTLVFWRNTMPHTSGGYHRHYFHDRIKLPTAYISQLQQQGNGGINPNWLAPARGIPFAFKHKTRFTIRNAEFEPGQALIF